MAVLPARPYKPKDKSKAEVGLTARPHPEHGYRACLGLLSLGKRYGEARLEAACARAQRTQAPSYGSIKSILYKGLDRLPLEDAAEPAQTSLPLSHGNLRGAGHYH